MAKPDVLSMLVEQNTNVLRRDKGENSNIVVVNKSGHEVTAEDLQNFLKNLPEATTHQAAGELGVPLFGLYRNGNFIVVRTKTTGV